MIQTAQKTSLEYLQITLLGGCQIAVSVRAIEMRRKPKQLIKLLALQPNHTLHREQIIELLWRDQETDAAINNLHKCVHAARRSLEPDLISGNDSRFILTKEGQIILTAPDEVRVDVTEFEELAAAALKDCEEKLCEAALKLYAGELLPEDLYEDWASERRESLHLSHRRLLEKLGAIYENSGRFERSAEIFQKLVQADELDEAARRNLMRVYTLQGNRAQAVRQFEICRQLLKKELGIEPEAETRTLFEQISSGKFAAPVKSASEDVSLQNSNQTSSEPAKTKTNLPHRLTSFIGREKEIGEIKNLLEAARLLTLTGAGGIGKTRLAQKIAAESIEELTGGAWFVELAALNDSSLIAGAAANALGVSKESNRPIVETLREFLRDKNALLVFDNCEHLIVSCARLISDLLEHCPHLRVLATSREALDAEGEIVWRVSALSLPEEVSTAANLENLRECEAVRLFVERAKLNNPNFALTASNALAIAQICRRLDGIPLALELAAARARIVSPETIAARLDDGLQILTGGGRNAAPRHQTLRAAIDWSYRLLSENEKTAWRNFSVFAGGFTLDAAEFICESKAENSVLDLLTGLTDKSIVTIAGSAENDLEIRYSLLETLRQYAAEKLRETGEETAARRRHFDYFLQLAERAESEFSKPEQREWFERLETEIDNFRAALQWSVSVEKIAADGLRACNALYRFWQAHGYLSEARGWFGTALLLKGKAEKAVRAEAFYRFGDLANLQGDFAEARSAFEQSVVLWREAGGDQVRLMGVVEQLAFVAVRLGEYARAGTLYGECLIFWRERNEQLGIARVLNGFGVLARYEGDYDLSASRLEESLAIFRTLNHKYGLTALLHNLGEAKLYQNDFDRAEVLLAESLDLAREIADKRWESYALTTLGNLAVERGDCKNALANFKAALVICREMATDRSSHLFSKASRARLRREEKKATRHALFDSTERLPAYANR